MKNGNANVPAVTKAAGLASRAVARLEAAAQDVLNDSAPTLQLTADTNGITGLLRDQHGTAVLIDKGRISVNVAGQAEAAE